MSALGSLCKTTYRGVARILRKGVLTLVRFAVGSMIVASTLLPKKLKGGACYWGFLKVT